MKPGKLDLDLYRGDTYRWRIYLWADDAKTLPVNLTGALAEAEIRDVYNSAMIMHLECPITLPNIINMRLPEGAWGPFLRNAGVWDLEVKFPNGDVKTQLAGDVKITSDVTNSRIVPTRIGARMGVR